MTAALTMLGVAWAGAALLMLAVWCVQLRTRNAGIVDAFWALGIGACVVGFAVSLPDAGWRGVAIAAMTATWSLRLGVHLLVRIRRDPHEDGRYQALREWAGSRANLAMFVFFQIQAVWVVLFALPQFVALHNRSPFGAFDLLAIAIFALSLVGESIADAQLARHRSDPAARGTTCRRGMWRYSRHPNYFFEWLHWFAYPPMAIGLGWVGLLTLLGPVLMLYFLLKVTGIPPTEARALRTRGDDYRRYQATTSAFFPCFPKSENAA